jgi:hypothetical protein
MDFLLAGTLDLLRMEFQCRVIVQRRGSGAAALPVENIPLQAEHHSARRPKLFAFPPEWCSPSDRNAVRDNNGMPFGFRPESRSPSTGFRSLKKLDA